MYGPAPRTTATPKRSLRSSALSAARPTRRSAGMLTPNSRGPLSCIRCRPTPRMPLHVLEHEGRAVGVRRLADVRRDLELGADHLRDVHELPGLLERPQVVTKIRHG